MRTAERFTRLSSESLLEAASSSPAFLSIGMFERRRNRVPVWTIRVSDVK
jgi:hypothetical protein